MLRSEAGATSSVYFEPPTLYYASPRLQPEDIAAGRFATTALEPPAPGIAFDERTDLMRTLCTVFALLAALPGFAQEVSILDLNTEGVALNPHVYLGADQPTLDGRLIFRADSDDGNELWVTDGTAAGTFVEELTAGAGDSIPDAFTAVGDRLFFTARNSGTGHELWTTAGPNQTSIVADLETGSGDSVPLALTALGDTLFFTAEVAGTRGLYTVDSLTLGVTVASSGVVEMDRFTQLVEDDSRVYFQGNALSGGTEEIWASDGTPGGTEQVTNLGCPEWGELLGVGASVFVVCDFGSSTELFRLDPTPASGVALVHRFGDRTVDQLTPAGGTLYMNVGNDEVWAYDGSTGVVSQITTFGTATWPLELTRYQGNLMFTASAGVGRELYWTDGTTVTEIDLRPGSASSTPEQLRVHDQKLYFTADDGVHGREMWVSDGTVAGTEMVVDFELGPGAPTIVLGSSTDFGLTFRIGYHELWITEGFAGGTVEVPFPPSLATSPEELHFDDYSDRLFFVGHLNTNGEEPFVTDGTISGTVPLGDIEPGPSGSAAVFLATLPNGRTLFTASSGADGRQLWSTQGLAGDGQLVQVIDPNELPVYLSGTVFGDHFYFCADNGIDGNELWRSDGTTAGTGMILDLHPAGDADPCDLAVFDDDLYFGAEDGTGGGLWRTDGTAAGTEVVAFTSPPSYGVPRQLTVWGDHLYFGANDGVVGEELWRSDGTEGGTDLFADINPGLVGSSPADFMAAGGLLYFTADNETTQRELWRTDGTPSGTFLIADIEPSGHSYAVPFAALNGGLVFRANTDVDHLFFTDGSPGSLTLLLSGYLPTYSTSHAMWNGDLYFAAGDAGSGSEDLWRTDGTVAGTENLQLEPVGTSSDPSFLTAGAERLYLSAYDAVTKREIHILEFPLFSDDFESGDTSAW